MTPASRPTPDQLLRQVEAEERHARSGLLKVFLGYASGVGKSFRMIDEGRRRRERGEDVVVAATQPEVSPELEQLLTNLEVIPLRLCVEVPVIDLEAILNRHPDVCLIDGLAYDNPSGSRNAHRWQDVQSLLSAGISVITTINLQYVEERSAEVESIRGKHVDVTVPEAFLRSADEIVVVDAPADSSFQRSNGAGPARSEQNDLSRLREIALLLAADVVDDQLEAYLERSGALQSWGTQERILVCITPKLNAARMLARARLARDRFHGELFAAYVSEPHLNSDEEIALEHNLAQARSVGAEIKLLQGKDLVTTIIHFARQHGITQIFIGHSLSASWLAFFTRTTVDRLIRAADGIDVKLFPH